MKEAGEKVAQEAREVEQARVEEEEREAAVAQQAAALEALVLKRQREKAKSLPAEPEKGADVTQVRCRKLSPLVSTRLRPMACCLDGGQRRGR